MESNSWGMVLVSLILPDKPDTHPSVTHMAEVLAGSEAVVRDCEISYKKL